jgi:beta-glucosidase-like glycosyl hydrolase
MVGHIGVTALDDVLVDGKIPPATLSRRITTDLLRREMGFGGLVVTDALNMGALKEFRHAPAACLKAGADVLLHPEDPDGCVEGLFAAINEKFLDEADVRRAYENILAAKEKFSLRPVRDSRIGRDGRAEVDFAAHAALSLELHRRSVTLLKGALAPFHPKRALLVLCGEYAPEKPRRAIDLTPLRDAFGVVVGLAEFTAATPRAGNKPVMFAVFTSVSAWRGTSGLDDDETGRLKSAIAAASARTCVISFGSPYVLSAFGGADVLIAAYEPSEGAQRAVVGCLMGEAAPRGRLPVVIPGL